MTLVAYHLDEGQRQMILLAIANLAHARPGWVWTLGNVADLLYGRTMFDEFRQLAVYGPLAGVGAIEGAAEEHIAAYHLGAVVAALRAESRDLDRLLEASAQFLRQDDKAIARLARLLVPVAPPDAIDAALGWLESLATAGGDEAATHARTLLLLVGGRAEAIARARQGLPPLAVDSATSPIPSGERIDPQGIVAKVASGSDEAKGSESSKERS